MGWTDQAWNRRYEALYKCQLSSLYHRKRERFFTCLDKWSTTLALVFGSAAMTPWLATLDAKALAGLAVAVVSLPKIVWGWSERARLHALLAGRFVVLAAEIEEAGVLTDEQANGWLAKTIRIESEEPAELSALTRICQNELAAARDETAQIYPLEWHQRLLAQVFDFPRLARQN